MFIIFHNFSLFQLFNEACIYCAIAYGIRTGGTVFIKVESQKKVVNQIKI